MKVAIIVWQNNGAVGDFQGWNPHQPQELDLARQEGQSEWKQEGRTRKREELIVLGQAQEAGKLGKLWSGSGLSLKPPCSIPPGSANPRPLGTQTPMVLQHGTLDLTPSVPTPTPVPTSYQPPISWRSGVIGWPDFDGLPFPQVSAL